MRRFLVAIAALLSVACIEALDTRLDVDSDGDRVRNVDDNCPQARNATQVDTDGDGQGDACDDDKDADGIDNTADNCQLIANPDQSDIDEDMAGDACDADRDGDGVPDTADNCRDAANTSQVDTDSDDAGDACDSDIDDDGIGNDDDNCDLVVNVDQTNTDMDALGDACDPDIDDDGVPNGPDNCDEVANADQANQDLDNLGDACDSDRDGDLIPNVDDKCPDLLSVDQTDTDEDGQGDVCDDDDDDDTVDDDDDNCPLVANTNQRNIDGDGNGDACDPDIDDDGIANASDNCPLVASAFTSDGDSDGVGDRCDTCDDTQMRCGLPANPFVERTISFTGATTDVVILDSRDDAQPTRGAQRLAYVAHPTGGFVIVELDRPDGLRIFVPNSAPVGASNQGASLSQSGDHVFLTTTGDAATIPQVIALDVSDIFAPVAVNSAVLTGGVAPGSPFRDTAIAGSVLYVANADQGLRPVNIADPAAMVVGTQVAIPDGESADQIAIEGDALVTLNATLGARLYTISAPLAPALTAAGPAGPIASIGFSGQRIIAGYDDTSALAGGSADPGLAFFAQDDVTTPAALVPTTVSTVRTTEFDSSIYALQTGPQVAVLSTSATPTIQRTVAVGTAVTPTNLEVVSGLAYITGGSGLTVTDIASAETPTGTSTTLVATAADPSRPALKSYQLSWDFGTINKEHVACFASGTCRVDIDHNTNSATIEWELPNTTDTWTMVVAVGTSEQAVLETVTSDD